MPSETLDRSAVGVASDAGAYPQRWYRWFNVINPSRLTSGPVTSPGEQAEEQGGNITTDSGEPRRRVDFADMYSRAWPFSVVHRRQTAPQSTGVEGVVSSDRREPIILDGDASNGTTSTHPAPDSVHSDNHGSADMIDMVQILSSFQLTHRRLQMLRASQSILRFLSVLNIFNNVLGMILLALSFYAAQIEPDDSSSAPFHKVALSALSMGPDASTTVSDNISDEGGVAFIKRLNSRFGLLDNQSAVDGDSSGEPAHGGPFVMVDPLYDVDPDYGAGHDYDLAENSDQDHVVVEFGLSSDQRARLYRIGLRVALIAPIASIVDLAALRGLHLWRRSYLVPWLSLYGIVILVIISHALTGIADHGFKWSYVILAAAAFTMYTSWRHIFRQYSDMVNEKPSSRMADLTRATGLTTRTLGNGRVVLTRGGSGSAPTVGVGGGDLFLLSGAHDMDPAALRSLDLPPKYEDLNFSVSASGDTVANTAPPQYSEIDLDSFEDRVSVSQTSAPGAVSPTSDVEAGTSRSAIDPSRSSGQ